MRKKRKKKKTTKKKKKKEKKKKMLFSLLGYVNCCWQEQIHAQKADDDDEVFDVFHGHVESDSRPAKNAAAFSLVPRWCSDNSRAATNTMMMMRWTELASMQTNWNSFCESLRVVANTREILHGELLLVNSTLRWPYSVIM